MLSFKRVIYTNNLQVEANSNMPRHLQFLIEKMKAARNIDNTVSLLEIFFMGLDPSSKSETSLLHCTWTNQMNSPLKIKHLEPVHCERMDFKDLDAPTSIAKEMVGYFSNANFKFRKRPF